MKLEMRAIQTGGMVTARAFVDNAEEAEAFGLRHGRDAEVYMGVAPRTGDRLYGLPRVLWVDVDFKQTPERQVRTELMLMDPEPSVIVNSGGGLHLYWILCEDVLDVTPCLRWLCGQVGGDMTGAEPARILRLPGTMNHKYTPPRMVKIEAMRPDLIYGAMDFGREEVDTVARSGYSGPTAGAAALSAARAWIAERAPAVEGMGGDKWTFDTACAIIRDYGLSEVDALELMTRWNEECWPPWSAEDLRKKIRGAMLYGRGEVGGADPARDFAGVEISGDEDGGPDNSRMASLTRRYRACIDSGKLRVYYMEEDTILGRSYWQCSSKKDFVDIVACIEYMGKVECGKKADESARMEDAAIHWLQCYKKKETYRGLVYMPECGDEKTPDGRLNVWRGFSPETKRPATTWDPLKQVILESICGGNEKWFDYVMGWLAFAVQRPHVPAMVALVLRGPKGTGKSSLGKYFVRLFGRHGMQLTSQERLTGRFNMHLRDVSALFADEAFWAGSKEGEGALKGLITEKTITYEGKGQNAEAGRNCIHVMMASNEHWVVPAGIDQERRFAVFDVQPDSRAREFWNALHEEMESGGGLAAMLNELMARDLSEFEIRDVPKTAALAEQKFWTLNPSEQWLVDLVVHGYQGLDLNGGNTVTMNDLETSIEEFFKHKRFKPSMNQIRMHLGKLVSRILPGAEKTRVTINEKREWAYKLPHPADARTSLEKSFGLDLSQWQIDSDENGQSKPKSATTSEDFF